MHCRNVIHDARRSAGVLFTALFLLALCAAPAMAAPSLGVDLARDEAEFPEVHRGDERADYTATVSNTGDEPTSGQVTLKIELPDGSETYKVVNPSNENQSPVGWTCASALPGGGQPAEVTCTRADALAASASYPAVKAIAALSDDVPDHAVAKAAAFGGGAGVPASDEVSFDFAPAVPFGITEFVAKLRDGFGADFEQAGGHPVDGIGEFAFAKKRALAPSFSNKYIPVDNVRQVFTDIPPGVMGSTLAIPELCPGVDVMLANECPAGSTIGVTELVLAGSNVAKFPIFAIEPEEGTPLQLAFRDVTNSIYTISTRLRPEDNYAISLEVAPAPKVDILEAKATVCDFGPKFFGTFFLGCLKPGEEGAYPKPLFTNPTRCGAPAPVSRARADSWGDPGNFDEAEFVNAVVSGCDEVPFEPEADLAPSTQQADSPTGLDIELTMPTDGFEDPEGIAQSTLKEAKVTFPEGMAVNASAANGLGACSADQIKLKTNLPIECPESSKVGTVEIDTPVIADNLHGSVYLAKQGEVDGSLLGIYLVLDSPKNGILIKLPSKIEPDPTTGQLVATLDEIPEAPFSKTTLHFPGGPRATLLTPPKCGDFDGKNGNPQPIKMELVPTSGSAPVIAESSFSVTSGPGGGPCPTGALEASMTAGTENPQAGKTSPFVMRLTRDDGSQRFSGLDIHMPAGLTGYLRGVDYCPNGALAAISSAVGTGQSQIDSPSCPSSSLLGTVTAGAGAGPDPFYDEEGRAYLAGPYKGAPLSIAAVVPAVAGPLDLGNVVIRNAVYVDPQTARIDTVSDPIPTILHGIQPDVRDIRIAIDRPGFTLNPTNCQPKAVGADLRGENGGALSLSNHFQARGCAALGFKPRVNLRLFGGIKRGKYQAVRAVVRPRPGDANIGRTVVRFPRSAFVAQENIRTVCTRVQFRADACPKGSIYGRAIAYSPLVDYPLRGNVYLRSSDNALPDAVADLRGPDSQPIRIELAIRNDSVKGALRNTVQSAPDAPVSYFRLQLFGGKKGLIVNSRNICRGKNKAAVRLGAQNGRTSLVRPNVFNSRCKKQRRAKRKKNQRHARRAALRKNLRAVR